MVMASSTFHLNFDTISFLSKNNIVIGLPKFKFVKDHLCTSCEIYLDPLFEIKEETPEVLIDFLRLVQRGLHAQVRTAQTDKGTEFLNKTLHAYFASEGINVTPPKIRVAAEYYTGALLHNTTAHDT
uniref:Retrovirus-related Pol polyprotein from transposon TNT 1-94 n=1 Tax=Tanacetum cinerariifolium TaxID=118510 RepID=A0A699QH84_TANCI|nr:retrovirus-related Pol polyprotein from transposon TNT 1-94 [Tanacetum cinerariifolium]